MLKLVGVSSGASGGMWRFCMVGTQGVFPLWSVCGTLPILNVLREQLLALLGGGQAHMGFDAAVAGFPTKEVNHRVPNRTYTIWHLLEHMRRTQQDILQFVVDPDYVSPEFPAGCWPKVDEAATVGQWRKTVQDIRDGLDAVEQSVRDPKTDFSNPIPHAKDYTVLREVLLVADHNAYHTAELVSSRRVLNLKPIKEY
jgi:hypothetical protein